MEPAVVGAVAVVSAYWLFSHRKTSGSFHTAARFMASWITPWLDAPSPKKEIATRSLRRIFPPAPAPPRAPRARGAGGGGGGGRGGGRRPPGPAAVAVLAPHQLGDHAVQA